MKICVRARYTPPSEGANPTLVLNLPALARRVKCYIGWKHDPTLGEEFLHWEDDPKRPGEMLSEKRRQGGWVATNQPETLELTDPEHIKFYADALRDGDLDPADQATATWAGVQFTPEKPVKAPDAPANAGDAATKKGG